MPTLRSALKAHLPGRSRRMNRNLQARPSVEFLGYSLAVKGFNVPLNLYAKSSNSRRPLRENAKLPRRGNSQNDSAHTYRALRAYVVVVKGLKLWNGAAEHRKQYLADADKGRVLLVFRLVVRWSLARSQRKACEKLFDYRLRTAKPKALSTAREKKQATRIPKKAEAARFQGLSGQPNDIGRRRPKGEAASRQGPCPDGFSWMNNDEFPAALNTMRSQSASRCMLKCSLLHEALLRSARR